jgi:hypothetical protein
MTDPALRSALEAIPRMLTWRIAEAFQEFRGSDADEQWVKLSDVQSLIAPLLAREEAERTTDLARAQQQAVDGHLEALNQVAPQFAVVPQAPQGIRRLAEDIDFSIDINESQETRLRRFEELIQHFLDLQPRVVPQAPAPQEAPQPDEVDDGTVQVRQSETHGMALPDVRPLEQPTRAARISASEAADTDRPSSTSGATSREQAITQKAPITRQCTKCRAALSFDGGWFCGACRWATPRAESTQPRAASADRDTPAQQEGIEHELRFEWWLNHGSHCRPYGDDGEMQCCALDFRRMDLDALRRHVEDLRNRRIAESQSSAVRDTGEGPQEWRE